MLLKYKKMDFVSVVHSFEALCTFFTSADVPLDKNSILNQMLEYNDHDHLIDMMKKSLQDKVNITLYNGTALKLEDMLFLLETICNTNPSAVSAHFLRTLIYIELNNYDQAVSSLHRFFDYGAHFPTRKSNISQTNGIPQDIMNSEG